MSEATGREASTIHRACRFGSDMASGENLACDVVIVDEFSMVDVFLFEALLKKITAGTRLVLVGDKDQLPSVGAGNVLADIMRSGAGDKVMHVVNNYDLSWTIASGYSYREGTGVYNGDIGVIREINSSRGEMTVEFEDGRVAVYTPDIYNQLVLAYAITVHKSQGSEFDAVILPVTAGGPMIMTRNLLYTAITRAKKMVVMIGERSRIKFMVDNNYVAARYSLLSDFIIEAQKDSALLFGKGDYDERT